MGSSAVTGSDPLAAALVERLHRPGKGSDPVPSLRMQRHPRAGGDPGHFSAKGWSAAWSNALVVFPRSIASPRSCVHWVPAYAGMTSGSRKKVANIAVQLQVRHA